MSNTIFLKNNRPRLLILSRFSGEKNENGGNLFDKYQLLPAGPAVEVPAEFKVHKVVKHWIKEGDVSIIESDLLSDDDDDDGNDENLIDDFEEADMEERKALLAKANSLGLRPRSNASLKKLNEMIADAESEKDDIE